MKTIRLTKDSERRINAGHLWIYSNEIDTTANPLKLFTAGETVRIATSFGKQIAIGYINPQCLLCVRVLTLDIQEKIDVDFFIRKIHAALIKRKMVFNSPCYRVVFGESDRLPGVVIDQFNETVILQINTAGIEQLKEMLILGIREVLKPGVLILKCDSSERKMEGLPDYTEVVEGTLPEYISIHENECEYRIPAVGGQKTGWYYDHRYSRRQISHYCHNKRVLDIFSYMGGFSIVCAQQGAKEVIAVDRSESALEALKHNAQLNGLDTIKTLQGDALVVMQTLQQQNEHFDVVVLDPPALIKRKKDIPAGTKMYQKLIEAALMLLNPNGILLSASCSMHLPAADLLNCIRRAGLTCQKEISVLEQCHQAPDHPVHPAISETSYLKGYIVFAHGQVQLAIEG